MIASGVLMLALGLWTPHRGAQHHVIVQARKNTGDFLDDGSLTVTFRRPGELVDYRSEDGGASRNAPTRSPLQREDQALFGPCDADECGSYGPCGN